jgi:hypothetical protein
MSRKPVCQHSPPTLVLYYKNENFTMGRFKTLFLNIWTSLKFHTFLYRFKMTHIDADTLNPFTLYVMSLFFFFSKVFKNKNKNKRKKISLYYMYFIYIISFLLSFILYTYIVLLFIVRKFPKYYLWGTLISPLCIPFPPYLYSVQFCNGYNSIMNAYCTYKMIIKNKKTLSKDGTP